MSLRTFSRFFYGHEVSSENNSINFDEGASERTAFLDIGSYTLTEYAQQIALQMTNAGTQEYSVSVNRSTRVLTISADSNFRLKVSTGTTIGTTAFNLMGFTGSDTSLATSHVGNTASGNQYSPQFILQDHVASDDWLEYVDGVVNQSASGLVEVVTFGDVRFVQFNIQYITDIYQPGSGPIINNASGVSDARAFMNYIVKKSPIEYMPDVLNLGSFQKLILESTPQSSKGIGYKLRELYDRGLPGYFETGSLKWRVMV